MEVIFWQQGKERVPLAEKLLAEKRIQDVRRMIYSRRAYRGSDSVGDPCNLHFTFYQ